MKNNIIRDDKYIAMKTETISTGTADESIASGERSAIEVGEMNGGSSIATPPIAHDENYHELVTELAEMNIEIPTETPPNIPPEVPPLTPPETPPPMIPNATESTISEEVSADTWASTQPDLTAWLDNAKSSTTDFFKHNQQLLITFGWILLAVVGAKFTFAALHTIDDIPLVTPLIKLVGLVTIVRFAWRYLIREHDRQELVESLNRTKIEVLGDRN
jgi:CAAD domains of cyanobacterial aminoacyl-tRNA synthetase